MTFASSSLLWRVPLVAIFAIFGLNTLLDAGMRGHLSTVLVNGLVRMGAFERDFAARHADLAVRGGALLEVAGAAALLMPGGERCGAGMLALFLLLVTPIAHWPMQDDATGAASDKLSAHHLQHMLKNLSMLGGLWLAWNVGCDRIAEKEAKAKARQAAVKVAAPKAQ